jgi:hypothetical protein
MALQNNFLPQTSLVFGVRDFVPQIEANAKQDREGLQNFAKLLMQGHDYLNSREQAKLMEQDSKGKKDLEDQIAADTQQLAELKEQLAALKGGV